MMDASYIEGLEQGLLIGFLAGMLIRQVLLPLWARRPHGR